MSRFAPIAALAVTALAAPAMADDDEDRHIRYAVSDVAAADIAASAGVATIDEMDRDDGLWEIEGRTHDGCEIEIDIHGQTGEVVKREIDDCGPRASDGHGDRDDWDDDRDD